jgi:hypothetical protein
MVVQVRGSEAIKTVDFQGLKTVGSGRSPDGFCHRNHWLG